MKKSKGKLSRRITWRVIGIMSFFNVLIVGVIVAFVFVFSLGNGSMRGQSFPATAHVLYFFFSYRFLSLQRRKT